MGLSTTLLVLTSRWWSMREESEEEKERVGWKKVEETEIESQNERERFIWSPARILSHHLCISLFSLDLIHVAHAKMKSTFNSKPSTLSLRQFFLNCLMSCTCHIPNSRHLTLPVKRLYQFLQIFAGSFCVALDFLEGSWHHNAVVIGENKELCLLHILMH